MPIELYELPNALLGLLVCSIWMAIGLSGYLAFHRVCRTQFAEGEKNLAIALLAVVATVNSLLLAFSAISVWESHGAADKAVRGEAVTIGALARNLVVYESADALTARDLLRTYARTVVNDEWPAMRKGQRSDAAWVAFEQVFSAIGRLDPDTAHETALMPEIWELANELLKHRRERLYASEAEVPSTLWIVVVAGTLLTITTTYIFPRTAFNTTAVGVLSLSLGLVFFFIIAMNRPFAGRESISPHPIASALAKMDIWSEEARKVEPQRKKEKPLKQYTPVPRSATAPRQASAHAGAVVAPDRPPQRLQGEHVAQLQSAKALAITKANPVLLKRKEDKP
jgi:hypothetical protein